MKKLGVVLTSVMLVMSLGMGVAGAEYLPQYDKYIEIPIDKARHFADAMGLNKFPLGEETAQRSFQFQEALIAKREAKTGKEIDHYYIWLTVDGKPVLAIDPPIALF
ncbi:8-amino-7-oxononanoate synthase [Brevibacillus ginsengisoli]|uniref:8-amino-7-oxononanoate synthase n=1 Tax=Brevibacillus ginsengisoli TaxID=363854 RepID=UPI003CEA35FE